MDYLIGEPAFLKCVAEVGELQEIHRDIACQFMLAGRFPIIRINLNDFSYIHPKIQ